jgi:tetratricopeptide (TPR) repeat protein
MNEQSESNHGALVPGGRPDLAAIAAPNPLVSRALLDLDLAKTLREMRTSAHEQFEADFLKNHLSQMKSEDEFYLQIHRFFKCNLGQMLGKKIKNDLLEARSRKKAFSPDTTVYLERGIRWSVQGEYDKAIQQFDEAIRLDPSMDFYYFLRGMDWYSKEDYDKAIKDFNEAIRFDSKKSYFLHRGRAWLFKNDIDNAIKDFNQAIRVDPNDACLYDQRGRAWWCKKKFDMAAADFDDAIRLSPGERRYYYRGVAHFLNEEIDKAIGDFDEAIRLNPEGAELYMLRGWAWFAKKDEAKAIRDFKRYKDKRRVGENV